MAKKTKTSTTPPVADAKAPAPSKKEQKAAAPVPDATNEVVETDSKCFSFRHSSHSS